MYKRQDLGASTWRHVAFVEQSKDRIEAARDSGHRLVDLGMPGIRVSSRAEQARTSGAGGAAHLAEQARTSGTGGAPAGYGTLPAPIEGHGPALTDMLAALRDGAGAPPQGPGEDLGLTADGVPMVGAVPEFRWLMSSDVCKHCTHAGCLDVCPTGALFRSEHGTVVVQADICNGCGYCVGCLLYTSPSPRD